jgi:hypothetical protein
VEAARLDDARQIYRELLTASPNRSTLIRIGEGLYRVRDFKGTIDAFSRVELRPGEEPYRYYIAVALFETGDAAGARRELTAALPYIEQTPDVVRYRDRILAARPQ